MLKRKAWDRLVEWKNNPSKKALCIIGARQIGKTTLVRRFGQEPQLRFAALGLIFAVAVRIEIALHLGAYRLLAAEFLGAHRGEFGHDAVQLLECMDFAGEAA